MKCKVRLKFLNITIFGREKRNASVLYTARGRSKPDVREHSLQPSLGVLVVFGPEELVDDLQRVLGFGRGRVRRPEHRVKPLPELQYALRHHVARTVLELFRPYECAHIRPRRRRVTHHAAHGRYALVAALAHRLLELIRHHVVADHVARRPIVAEPRGHLIGRGFSPHPFERVRVHQFGYRTRQHLRPTQTQPARVFARARVSMSCMYVCVCVTVGVFTKRCARSGVTTFGPLSIYSIKTIRFTKFLSFIIFECHILINEYYFFLNICCYCYSFFYTLVVIIV